MGRNHLILDGYNLIHRARGGFKKGPWPVVFNFFRGLRPLIEKYDPLDVFVVLEGTPQRNLQLLPEYKGNRGPAPEGFERQKEVIVDLLQKMPITLVQHPRFEADDVVYNLVNDIGPTGAHVFVVSSDSDFTQLLQMECRGRPPMHNITVFNWREKMDLVAPVYDYVMWKALRGDATDNIPKCPGMTDKAALRVVEDGHKLVELLQDATFKAAFDRNLELVGLQDFTLEDRASLVTIKGEPDWDHVKDAFDGFGFKSMTREPSWTKYISTFSGIGVGAPVQIP